MSTLRIYSILMVVSGILKIGILQELNFSESCFDTNRGMATGMIFSRCNPYLSSPYTYLLPESYDNIKSDLETMEMALQDSTPDLICSELLVAYICNYVYIPCDGTQTRPVGICQNDCTMFLLMEDHICLTEINLLLLLSDTIGFPLTRQCDNTLYILESYGINFTASSRCVSFPDLIGQLQPESTSAVIVIAVALSVVLGIAVLIAGLLSVLIIRSCRHKKLNKRKNRAPIEVKRISQPSRKEEQLFKISVDDIQCNSQLSKALVSFHCLEIMEEIGHGAFGSVYKGRYKAPNSEGQESAILVAVKTIKSSSASYLELKGFLEESAIMSGFNHPHVLGLIGISLDPSNSPHLLLPFMENGDLRSYLKSKRNSSSSRINNYPRGLRYETLRRMCYDIARGMAYLSARRLVHRDLAARNCMVDKYIRVRVADFGLTRDIYKTDYYRQSELGRVPVKWMALESLHDRISDEKTDVWSYGVTCWEVFSLGRIPYPTISNADMLLHLEQGSRLKKPYLCSDVMYELMTSCWNQDPQKRPDFSSICTSLESMSPSNGQQQSANNNTHQTRFQELSVFSSGRSLECSSGQNSYLSLVRSGASNQALAARSLQASSSLQASRSLQANSSLVPNPRLHTSSSAAVTHSTDSEERQREQRNKSLHKIVKSTSFLHD